MVMSKPDIQSMLLQSYDSYNHAAHTHTHACVNVIRFLQLSSVDGEIFQHVHFFALAYQF